MLELGDHDIRAHRLTNIASTVRQLDIVFNEQNIVFCAILQH